MKKIALTALVILIVLAGVGYWMWNKPHEDIAGAKAELSIQSDQLLKEFETNEQAANTKFVGKLIQVSGKIFQIDNTADGSVNILLESENPMSTVLCQLDPLQKQDHAGLAVGQAITLKGKCSGFTTDVVLDRCHIVK